jgi:hypothetical protein
MVGEQKVSPNKNLAAYFAVLKLILFHLGLYTNLSTEEYEEPDACFVPRRLLGQRAQNPCDKNVCMICQYYY